MKKPFKTYIILVIIHCIINEGVLNAQNQISPYLYGVNAWMPDEIGGGSDGGPIFKLNGELENLWDRVGESNPRIIRIGGIIHDDFRPSTEQYVNWINSIRSIGAEPLVQVSRGKDSSRSFPSQAAALVNELNNVLGMNIKYWAIGNEPDFHYYNFDLSNQNLQTITNYIKSFSNAMKNQDPNILIVGAAFSNWKDRMPLLLQPGPYDISGISPQTGKPYIDVFDWHYYPMYDQCYTFENAINVTEAIGSINACKSWYGLRGKLQELRGLLDAANSRNNRTGSNALTWGITEFHITVSNPGGGKEGRGTASFLAGQYWADVMGMSAEFGGEFTIGWSIHESGGRNNFSDLGFLGNANGSEKRSTFYHLKILSNDLSGEFISGSNNLWDVKTYAAKEGNLYKVLVMNQGKENSGYNYSISFNNNASGELAINLDGGSNINHSGFINNRETKLFVFTEGNNNPIKVVTYNLDMYENNEPPSVVGQNPQSPYLTQNIPGKIQIEDFDIGGQGVAYNDTNSVSNTGGEYRNEGVDIEATSNDGGGFNVGWIESGEWTEYTIANVNPGTYNISVDIASDVDVDSAIEVSLDGVNIGTFNPVNTNGWQTWETLKIKNVTLLEGTNKILRLDYTGNFNIDFINFEQVTLSVEELSAKEYKVFPNPTKDILNINFEKEGYYSFFIHDISGKKIIDQQKLSIKNTFNISKYAPGIYFLKIEDKTNNTFKNFKIVKL